MKKHNAIEIENVSKEYRLGVVSTGTLSHDINRWWHRIRGKEDPYLKIGEVNLHGTTGESDYIFALQDINVEVKQGEVLGIIGKNGAGKSTLLKILSKVTGPSTGAIHFRGRIGSLLEVGTGFHLELTGRENIFLNGAILGMTKAEIKRKFDEIVEFSGITRYVDTPVKRYSSGMLVRLGFAVAAFLEPEILVVDEVLAVGDAEFQKKAIGKMQDVSKYEGRTVLFVSHNMAAIKTLCTTAILLDNGQTTMQGKPDLVINEYLKTNDIESKIPLLARIDRSGIGNFKFKKIFICNANREITTYAETGKDMYFCLQISILEQVNKLTSPLEIGIIIRDQFGNILTTLASFFTNENPSKLEDAYNIMCFVPKLPILSGEYNLDLWAAVGKQKEDWIQNAFTLLVKEGNYFQSEFARLPNSKRHGKVVIPQKWLSTEIVFDEK